MFRVRAVFLIAIVAATAISLPNVAPEPATAGGNIVVDTNLNNDVADGLCSLREAIIAANTNALYQGCAAGVAGTDHITFALGAQTRTISVATELPTISSPIFIDGGPEKVELRGPGGAFVSGDDGLTIDANGDDVRIHNLVINSFRADGILSYGANTQLEGNFIGTDVTGTIAMPNQGFGVQIHDTGAVIGGSRGDTSCVSPCNLISGNAGSGIFLDINSTSAMVMGNFIGTEATGTAALVPLSPPYGIEVKGDFHTIGLGLAVLPGNACLTGCNVITGKIGVWVTAAADTTKIGNNFIGTDVTGTLALQSTGTGVRNAGHHTSVGGEPDVAGNLISGWGTGILAEADLLFVEHNFIGTNFDGDEAILNTLGINVFGGTTTVIQNMNVISGNTFGVYITGSGGVQIRGNLIGLAADGVSPLGNLGDGILIGGASTLNSVGGIADQNEIAFNGSAGVGIDGPTAIRNIIGANSIHDNGGLGIDNLNGGNTELAPPTITFASVAGAAGMTCPTCTVLVFSDEADEGRVYEGQATAGGTGAWTFSPLVGELLTGPNVTATVMDPLFNTSEFSAPFVIFEPTPSPSPTPSASPGPDVIQGNFDCNMQVDVDDAFYLLKYVAQLNDGDNTPPCPDITDLIFGYGWGDVNCDGVINILDVLYMFRFAANLVSMPANPDCVPVGGPVD